MKFVSVVGSLVFEWQLALECLTVACKVLVIGGVSVMLTLVIYSGSMLGLNACYPVS